MELTKDLKDLVNEAKELRGYGNINVYVYYMSLLRSISNLCEQAGETQWSIKDQIDLAIQELEI